jgi:hypothetical protein
MVLPLAAQGDRERENGVRLFVGDDGAEAHQEVEVMDDDSSRRLAKARLPEGWQG